MTPATAAHKLATRGLAVVPLHTPTSTGCSCRRSDCAGPGKHPRVQDWTRQASSDPEQVEKWWRQWSDANIGIATGAISGLLVLDIDPRHGGDEALAELEREHGELPPTTEVLTGGGGRHLYFKCDDDVASVELAPGLEVKSAGRQVVAPPSLHESGRRYEWEVSSTGLVVPPAWLLAGSRRNGSAAAVGDEIPEHARNNTLASIAGSMRRRGMDAEEIAIALRAVNERRCRPPLPEEEVERIASSIARYPAAPSAPEGAAQATAPADDHEDDANTARVEAEAGKRKVTRPFIARPHAEALVAETPVAVGGGQIYVWRAGHYRPGERDLRQRIAQRLGDDWRRNRAEDVVVFARDSAPALWPEPPRDRINVANGILDLASGKLEQHDPEFLSPIQLAAAYDPAARCPRIERFLDDVLGTELRQIIFELTGYLVTPDQALQVAVMLLGEGANGKSTLLGVLSALLGAENVSNVALHKLDEDRFAPAELYGKLANVFADLDARALAASSIFKAITGGDAITGERKYAAPFTFRPYARLLYSANTPPPTPDSSDAFFRRWLILPFERRFDGQQADRRLLAKLITPEELSGLLNRGLEALPALRKRGAFRSAKATAEAAERFRVDSDSVAGFLADACKFDPQASTPRPGLFNRYRNWCSENNRKPLSAMRFNRRVEALRPTLAVKTVQGTEHWGGIALR